MQNNFNYSENVVIPREFTQQFNHFSKALLSGISGDSGEEAKIPKPVGYRVLVALPQVSDNYEGSSILKTDKEKKLEYVMSIIGLVLDMGAQAYNDEDRFDVDVDENGPFIVTADEEEEDLEKAMNDRFDFDKYCEDHPDFNDAINGMVFEPEYLGDR